ncbi:MAG TPA: hypothetical protein VHV10_01900 [Ktedonobacteraceae bacterium]|nr:hypothetical protein [Ktedonobacteraceae bacterium]
MRQAFSPLDEELGLQPGSLTPRQQEHLVHLSLWMPFGRAVKLLNDVTGVQISEATGRRQTEAAGAAYERWQNERADQLCGMEPKTSRGSSPAQIAEEQGKKAQQESSCLARKRKKSHGSCNQRNQAKTEGNKLRLRSDGAMVPLVGGDYVEVKTLVIGRVQAKEKRSKQRPDQHVETVDLSYFSRLADAETFGRRAIVETERRGVSLAGQVCAVQDGAEWIQGFVDLHAPDAVRILDFAHARGYLAEIAELVREAGTKLPADWLEIQCHDLKHHGPMAVFKEISLLRRFASRRARIADQGQLPAQARAADAVSTLSAIGLASWQWQCGKFPQIGGAGTTQRCGDVLGALSCQSHAGFAHRDLS